MHRESQALNAECRRLWRVLKTLELGRPPTVGVRGVRVVRDSLRLLKTDLERRIRVLGGDPSGTGRAESRPSGFRPSDLRRD